MQTFLPDPSFTASARILDKRRVWKQTVEAKQLIDALENGSRWSNHPACLMWKGFEEALKCYFNEFLKEVIEFREINTKYEYLEINRDKFKLPWWLGNEEFHRKHRIALLTKNPVFYLQYHWKESADKDYKYFWPVVKCHFCYGSGKSPELGEEKCSCCRGTGLLKIQNDGITPIIEFAR
jgi:hypothetical protein